MADQADDCVQVVCRVRPMNKREVSGNCKAIVGLREDQKTLVVDGSTPQDFQYDHCFGPDSTQDQLFSTVGKPLTASVADGYNGTIFAYGQTGSGKTHTILGSLQSKDEAGLLPRVLEHLFSCMKDKQDEESDTGSSLSYSTKCSFLEIYNERIIDLLDASSSNLRKSAPAAHTPPAIPEPSNFFTELREDSDQGVYVDGLTEEIVESPAEALGIMSRGARNRHIGCTAMNRESSRSHSVFTLLVECKETAANGLTKSRHSRFNLIDLAGSERQKSTNASGSRLKEASNINKSLSELGNVIQALVAAAKGRAPHVPYRNSKLTFLLRDSLGGNSKTFIVATVSPAEDSFGETLSTLKFAARAKLVKNKAVVNEDSSGTVDSMAAEIRRLQAALQEARQLIGSGAAAGEGGAAAAGYEQGSGRAMTAARAVSAILPSIAKVEALYKATAAAHAAGLRAGGSHGDAGSDAIPAGVALELLARAHAEACDTGLPPLALLQAAQGAAEELAAARAAAATATARASHAEAAKETLSTALERYADLVSRYEQCVSAQRLRLKLRDSALSGGAAAASGDGAAAEIAALEAQLVANPDNVRLQMMIDDLMEASAEGVSGLLDAAEEEDGADGDNAEDAPGGGVVSRESSRLRLPASLTYVPAALHAAVAAKLVPLPASTADLGEAHAQMASLVRENQALKASLQQHEVTWENAETAAKARREEQVIAMQQWREEQRWGAKEESLRDALEAAHAATAAAQEAAAAEAAKVVQASAAAANAEGDAREKGVRLDAMELTVARLRREVSTATATGEEEVASVRDNMQSSILELEAQVAALRAQLLEAQSAGEEALALVEQSQGEAEGTRAQLQTANAEATALKAQLRDTHAAQEEAERDLEQAQADAQEAAGLLAASSEQIAQLKEELQAAKTEIKQKEIVAQRAEFDFENLVEDAEQNSELLGVANKRIAVLREEAAAAAAQLHSAQADKDAAEATAAKAAAALAELRDTASASASEEQAAAAAVRSELDAVKASLAQLRGDTSAAQEARNAAVAEAAALRKQLAQSRAEAEDANAAAGDATSKAIAARKALEVATADLQKLQLSSKVAADEAAVYSEDLLDQLDETRAQLGDASAQLQSSQDELLKAQAAEETSAAKLRTAEQLCLAAEEAAAKLRNELVTAQAAASAAAADAAAATSAAEDATANAESERAEMHAAADSLRQEVAELQEKLAIVTDESKEASQQAHAAEQRVAALEQQLHSAQADCAQAQGDLALVRDELMATKGGVQAAKAASSQAQGALQAIQAELRATDATLSAVSESLEEEVEARKAAEAAAAAAASKAQTEVTAAQADSARSKAALSKATDRLEVLEAQSASLRMVQEQLLGGATGGGSDEIMAALEAQRAKAAAAAADAAVLQERVTSLGQQLAQAQAAAEVNAAAAKDTAAAAAERATTAAAALAASKAELSQSQEDLSKARARVAQLEGEQEDAEKQAGLVQRLETQLARVMQERDTAQTAAKDAQQAVVDAKDKAAAAGGVSGSQAGEIAALQTEVAKLTQKVLSEKARNRILTRERDHATAEAAAAAREAADATAAHRTAVADVSAAATRAASAGQQADSSAGVVAGYAAQLSAARDAMSDLANAVLHLRARLTAAEEQLQSSARVKMTLRLNKQLKEAKQHIAELEAGRAGSYPPEIAARDRAINKLQTELGQLTGAIAAAAQQLGLQVGSTSVPAASHVASSRVPQCVPLRSVFAAGTAGAPIRQAMAVVNEMQSAADVADADLPALSSEGLSCIVEQSGAAHSAAAAGSPRSTAAASAHVSAAAAKQLVLLMAGTVQGWAAASSKATAAAPSPARAPSSPLGRAAAVPRSPLTARSANTPVATPQRKHGVQGLTYSPGGRGVMHPPAVGTPEYIQWAASSNAASSGKGTPSGSRGDSGFFC